MASGTRAFAKMTTDATSEHAARTNEPWANPVKRPSMSSPAFLRTVAREQRCYLCGRFDFRPLQRLNA